MKINDLEKELANENIIQKLDSAWRTLSIEESNPNQFTKDANNNTIKYNLHDTLRAKNLFGSIASIYKDYIEENTKFKDLKNKNIELYNDIIGLTLETLNNPKIPLYHI